MAAGQVGPSMGQDKWRLASAWVAEQSTSLPWEIAGQLEIVQDRPWSSVMRVATTAGTMFLKVCEEQSRFEAGLLQLLSERHADCSPVLLAADAQHGYLLMEDAGQRLREILNEENWLEHWQRILARYAELQLDMSQYSQELIQLGLPDRRLPLLPDRLEAILAEDEFVLTGQRDGLTQFQLTQLKEMLPSIRIRCTELQKAGIPNSVNHGDFHDGNIFVKEGRYIFTDWGDASLSHPFFSLRTTFVSLENTLGFEEHAPIFNVLRDGYLQSYSDYGSNEHLVETFELAWCLWSLGSLLSWHTSLKAWAPAKRVEYRDVIPSLLIELLEANRG